MYHTIASRTGQPPGASRNPGQQALCLPGLCDGENRREDPSRFVVQAAPVCAAMNTTYLCPGSGSDDGEAPERDCEIRAYSDLMSRYTEGKLVLPCQQDLPGQR